MKRVDCNTEIQYVFNKKEEFKNFCNKIENKNNVVSRNFTGDYFNTFWFIKTNKHLYYVNHQKIDKFIVVKTTL